ncbi:hypothetical protein HID58_092422, partial [Brassica napus]
EKIGLKAWKSTTSRPLPPPQQSKTTFMEALIRPKDAKEAARRKAEEAVGTTKEKAEGAYETAKSKAGETIGP